jgi:YVTN family beta-propeller protein
VRVGLLPYTVVAIPGGNTAYVAANGNHAVVNVDIKQARVLTNIPVGRNPWSLAYNAGTNALLVTNNRSSSLSLLKTGAAPTGNTAAPTRNTMAVASTINIGPQTAAKNIAMTSDGATGAFTDLANNQVGIVDTNTGQVTKRINVGKAPYGIEFIRPSS